MGKNCKNNSHENATPTRIITITMIKTIETIVMIIIIMEVAIPDDGELVMTMNTDRDDNDDDDDNCKTFLSSRLINGRMNEYKTRRK